MHQPPRRQVLGTVGTIAIGALAGCGAIGSRLEPDRSKRPGKDTDTTGSLTDWERSTDCEEEYDRLHDSVIKVAEVKTELGEEYDPIHYEDLSAEEQTILGPVTETGGYGTCNPTDAFSSIVDRVIDHTQQQSDSRAVYLERDGTYYGLYVEQSDEVYAY